MNRHPLVVLTQPLVQIAKTASIYAACFGLVSIMTSPSQASVSDFVCRGLPSRTQAVFYPGDNNRLRDCTRRTPDANTGMCQERVECAYFPPIQRSIRARNYAMTHSLTATTYEQFAAADRDAMLREVAVDLVWHESTVSCPGRIAPGADGGAICPSPDRCKADVLIESRPARIDYADEDAALNPRVFTPGERSRPSTAGAANPTARVTE